MTCTVLHLWTFYSVNILPVLNWYRDNTLLVLCWYRVNTLLVLNWYRVYPFLVLSWYRINILLVQFNSTQFNFGLLESKTKTPPPKKKKKKKKNLIETVSRLTMIHLFCDCESVSPIWQTLRYYTFKTQPQLQIDKVSESFLGYYGQILVSSTLIYCLKYYI